MSKLTKVLLTFGLGNLGFVLANYYWFLITGSIFIAVDGHNLAFAFMLGLIITMIGVIRWDLDKF